MPVEINQLHIKVNVSSPEKQEEIPSQGQSKKDREGIIAACVEAVLEVLKQKEMR
ncbi:DUF5908 family protein [Poritiphilus flavus]|uniref:Uncharacterized protein n=1 Tax=Poritiphilus flavus TaxID=2697053 RepID=A0A6L9EI30_9FLAO|nr:DUF5908 family protein [Poritiphilus flavus]NAS14306.1 hypothetical protein [Poritiphilus flavus]